ncbi:MAG: methyl-accepting chemotaxis protein, partial [Burkholderiales bacterium]
MLNNIKIGVRLGLGFLFMVLLTILLAIVSYDKILNLHSGWKTFEKVTLAKRIAATEGYVALGDGIHMFKDYLLRGGSFREKFMSDMDEVDASVAAYRTAGSLSGEEEQVLADILKNSHDYRTAIAEMAELKARNLAIPDIDRQIKGADRPLGEAFARLLAINELATRTDSGNFSAQIRSARTRVVATCLAVVVLAGLLSYLLTRSLTRPLSLAVTIARRMAEGNLAVEIEASGKDEAAQLVLAMKQMSEKLTQVIAEVRSSANALASASEEVSATAQSMSQATSEQAASVEETSASIEEMTASIEQ